MLQANREPATELRTRTNARGPAAVPPRFGTPNDAPLKDAPANATTDGSVKTRRYGTLRYRTLGCTSNPLVVVLGGISADRRVDRWWAALTGVDGALSPGRFRLLSMDWSLPDNDGQSGTVDEQADALAALLDALGIVRVPTFVGASFGAMVGISFAARHPDRLDRLFAISGAHRATPAATAGRVIQRRIVETLKRLGDPELGVSLARGLALTSYRPAELFDQRFFNADPDRVISRIGGYFEHIGTRFAEQFAPDRYLTLSTALDRHCIDPGDIGCRTDLIGANSDTLVPVSQLRELTGAIGIRGRLHVLDSPFGHDAFLKSPELLGPLLERLLAEQHREVVHG